MKQLLQKKQSPIIYITLCLAMLCWLFLFAQIITEHIIFPPQQAIPAFQPVSSNTEDTSMLSCTVSAFSDIYQNTSPNEQSIYSFLKQYDSDIRLISCHQEKNYTDLYFYSPLLQDKFPINTSRQFNLQVAITDTSIYFGTPFLQYDF